jgi:glucosylglycerate synthase
MEPAPLPAATEAQVRAIGTADVVVGIPSYNNASTIGHVAGVAGAGLAKYFPEDLKPLLVSEWLVKDKEAAS